MTAADARNHLDQLLAERHLAAAAGLDGNATYMDDLESDLAETQVAYEVLAVSEIAQLRASLDGPLHG